MLGLLNYLSVPTDFMRERNEGSPCTFGSRSRGNGRHCECCEIQVCTRLLISIGVWTHFSSKHIVLDEHGKIRGNEGVRYAGDNWIWESWAFYLEFHDSEQFRRPQVADSKSHTDAQLIRKSRFQDITLCCFAGPGSRALEGRLKAVNHAQGFDDVLIDPMLLFDIALDEMIHMSNQTNKHLRGYVVYQLENVRLDNSPFCFESR